MQLIDSQMIPSSAITVVNIKILATTMAQQHKNAIPSAELHNGIVLFRTVVQWARAEAMGVGLKHSTNNRSYVNCCALGHHCGIPQVPKMVKTPDFGYLLCLHSLAL